MNPLDTLIMQDGVWVEALINLGPTHRQWQHIRTQINTTMPMKVVVLCTCASLNSNTHDFQPFKNVVVLDVWLVDSYHQYLCQERRR